MEKFTEMHDRDKTDYLLVVLVNLLGGVVMISPAELAVLGEDSIRVWKAEDGTLTLEIEDS